MGWDLAGTRQMLEAGMSVNPEAMASFHNSKAVLEAELFIADAELRLRIVDRTPERIVRLAFSVKHSLSIVLRRVTELQGMLTGSTFPALLTSLGPFQERVWFIDHEGNRFDLQSTDA